MVDLTGYSVLVDNKEQARKLQEIAIEQGFEWEYLGKSLEHLDERAFIFGFGGKKVIMLNSKKEHYQDESITKKAHFNELFRDKFVPTAMRCTQEQFDAIRPKLKGLKIKNISSFFHCNYLVNNLGEQEILISNVMEISKGSYNREVYEEWNEELFLKACGIEPETLQEKEQRLLKELEEVRKEIEENEIKAGDWVWNALNECYYKKHLAYMV